MARYIVKIKPCTLLPVKQIMYKPIAPSNLASATSLRICRRRLHHKLGVLVVVYIAGFVDQQHRNAVVDAIGTPQSRVVERLATCPIALVNQHQGPPVSWAHQNAQQ
uniref:Uncharacterized protein MLC1351.20 n=1 Tax=Mycobacterium leprae TaxID=1769 RepID=O05681_MYCLR|nr:hypothetical protein MLC1351.20 [Mycobacterium leprae]